MNKVNAPDLKLTNNLLDYLLIFIALVAWWGAVVYYLYALNWIGIVLSLLLSIASFIWLRPLLFSPGSTLSSTALSDYKNKWDLPALYILVWLILIAGLWNSRSASALVSPWQVVNPNWLYGYTLASLVLIIAIIRRRLSTNLKIFLISLHYFLSFSVAVIIYKIGYGFDPFIHQATMELIAAKGFVLPKPPYYLGEYSLIVILSKISGLSIYYLNKILVPLLAALFLPGMAYRFLRDNPAVNFSGADNVSLLTILMILSLTFAPFILTTPQNLSYLFLILTVLAALSRYELPGVIILALATTAIHPLTGLPALALVAWLIFKKYQNRLSLINQKIGITIIWLFAALSLPLALLKSAGNNIKAIGGGSQILQPLSDIIGRPNPAGQENLLLNLTYWLGYNYNLLLIIVIIAALWLFYRRPRHTYENAELWPGLIFINSALLIAYLLIQQIIFNSLISYEQTDYANRITIIIIIFFLPFILALIRKSVAKIQPQNKLTKIIFLVFSLSLLSASLYLSYPRLDRYWNSRGYSTSADDIAAVDLVDKLSPAPYIVLADQQVSVAALQEFGFNHYYQTPGGPLYFYPIPTGGPLYQYYLNLAYGHPSRAALLGALNLAGVNRAYFIINKYWYQSDRLISQAQLTANEWWTINNQVYIFEYSR
jgi:hypothetical protein